MKISKSLAYNRDSKKMDFCTRGMGGHVWKILAAGFAIFSSLLDALFLESCLPSFPPSLERGQCTEGMV